MSLRPSFAAAVFLLLQGCVVVPRTVERYDAECRTQARHMVLDTVAVASIGSCSNRGCEAAIAVAGITAAASAVVSGSIAVVGNAAYWLEKQGRCDPTAPAPAGPPRAPAPSPAPGGPSSPPA